MSLDYRTESRLAFTRPEGIAATYDDVRMGCLQRIADALEKIAHPYAMLAADAEREKRYRLEAEKRTEREKHRSAALRGVIGRMKRKGA